MRIRGCAWLAATALLASACSGAGLSSTTANDPGGSRDSRASDTGATTAPVTTTQAGTARSALVVGDPAWVSVSVATLWRTPDSPRAVDTPALRNPAQIRRWLQDMTLAQRRDLDGRADTQALLGDRVVVLALPSDRPGWARVAVPSQPSPLDSRGYPGWVPRRQLTATTPVSAARRATVMARTAWLLTDATNPVRLFRVSLGTALPVVGRTPTFVRVAVPGGAVRRLAGAKVVVHDAGQPALAPSRAGLVSTARKFLGLPYLWAGASGFGLDCSGLTWLVHRVSGIRIPRDAGPQSRHGRLVGSLRRGDLMFFARNGVVHHVSMYVGGGLMIHSPGTGLPVAVIATSTWPYAQEHTVSRRYLP